MVSHRIAEAEELARILKEWHDLEDETISLAESLMSKSNNDFVKVIMEMIKRDSEKHKSMQEFAINHLTKEAVRLSHEELVPLSEVLDRHVAAEAKSMGLANIAMTKSTDYFTNFIITYLLMDEIKHHEMLTKLDHIKGQIYPYGQTREERLGGARL
ncbi:MAG: hypothetical protein AB1390_01650 [Nitrospirota bacterium]